MLRFETVIETVVMTAWLIVLVVLYRRFRRQEVAPLPAGLAAAAVALGLLSAIPGLLHTVAVAGGAVNNHKSYDLRLAWLLTVGLILMYSGSVNVLLSSRIKRSDPWAVTMSASATALLVAFLAVLQPAKPQTLLIVLNSAYLTLLLVRSCRGQITISRGGLAVSDVASLRRACLAARRSRVREIARDYKELGLWKVCT